MKGEKSERIAVILEVFEVESGNEIGRQIVIRCPNCGRKHYHTGGLAGEDDLESYFGGRAAHCATKDYEKGGYVIQAPEEGYLYRKLPEFIKRKIPSVEQGVR